MKGIQSFVGTVFELRQSLARGRLHQEALFEKYDVYGKPAPDDLLISDTPGMTESYEMDTDTMQAMLARAPLWRLRSRVPVWSTAGGDGTMRRVR